ncbi:DUF29 domain-containing protein [Falsiroseomonas sp. CW058]|uniref:DUF29 domain-containing protein n=1 Tax=Falsiroseomonas sp. CW058 TaxID=3388664 RepID=UPI003D313B7D
MPDDLYHRDFVAWSRLQADRLRRLAAGERVNDLDWANLIEEVEDLGKSETKAVESLLAQALIHAMKLAAWPMHPAGGHWRGEIRTFLNSARRRFSPSMGQLIDLAGLHADALDTVRATSLEMPPLPLRDGTDLTLAELLDRDLPTDALVARLRRS